MPVARAMLAARDIRAIEDELVKLERALDDAEERRATLKLWVAEIRRKLKKVARIDATDGSLARSHPVRMLREAEATVSRAVERGWIVLRDEVSGRAKQRRAALTEVDRLLARKAPR